MPLATHITTIRSWLNEGDDVYDDPLVTSWTRMAEELLDEELRCKHMIQIDTGNIVSNRVLLPTDWLELDFVRNLATGKPLRYRSRDEFYDDKEDDPNHSAGYYSLSGNYMLVGGQNADGVDVEITYYQTIPRLETTDNWLMTYYSRLYTLATLSVGAAYSFEDDRAPLWESGKSDMVDLINNRHKEIVGRGSKINMPRKKGFG